MEQSHSTKKKAKVGGEQWQFNLHGDFVSVTRCNI